MCMRYCDNGIWQDNFVCSISGAKNFGDYHGFSSPYQRAEFLKLTYTDVAEDLLITMVMSCQR